MGRLPAARRWPAVALAIVLVASAGAVPVGPPTVALAAGPAPVASLALPSLDTLREDAAIAVSDTPVPVDDPVAVDDAIADAYGATDVLDPADWDVATLARGLGDDPDAAFRFVRDRVALDAYPGVLRGADGTLAARGGNALDRALLLQGLLAAMGRTTRFVVADLDGATASRVAARVAADPIDPLPLAGDVVIAPLDGGAIAQRALRDHARLRLALGDRAERLGVSEDPGAGDGAGGPSPVVTPHVWVQMATDAGWLDLDPTMPDAQPGQTLVTASRTLDTLPLEMTQRVTLRLVAETLQDGTLTEEVVLGRDLAATDAALAPVFLFFQPETSGGGLLSGGGPATAYLPGLVVGGEATLGDPFPIGEGGGGGLGGFGGALGGGGGEPAFVSLRLVVTTQAPGADPIEASRTLVDRAPAAERTLGLADPAQLLPLTQTADGPLAFHTIHHVMTSTGGADPLLHAILRGSVASIAADALADPDALARQDLGDILLPIAVADDTLTLVSERSVVPALDATPGARAWIGRPRVTIVSYGPDPARPDAASFLTDLLIDGVDVQVDPGADPDLAARLRFWYGVVQTALETEMGLALARGLDPASRLAVAPSLMMGEPLAVLDASWATPADAPAALAAALAEGRLVVAPGDPTSTRAWWTVDLASGATRSIIDAGLGGVWNSGWGVKPTITDPGKVWEIPDYDKAERAKELLKRRGRCRGGNEYIAVVGCVSVPVATAITAGLVVVVISAIGVGILWALASVRRRLQGHVRDVAVAPASLLGT